MPRAALVLAALLLASPLASMSLAATSFDATFTPTGSNAWWIQASVSANAPIASVSARVNEGSWQPLTLRSYGWAASIAAPAGSIVQLRAVSTGGATDHSGCYQWTSRAPTACPATAPAATTTTSTTSTTTSTASAVTFKPAIGNEWWVQVEVSGGPTKVEARDTDGSWTALTQRSYGWAGSVHVEKGHQVQYRATLAGGSTSTSCWFVHPGTTCATTSTPTSATTTTTTTTSSPTTTTVTPLWKDSFTASPWSSTWNVRSSWGLSNAAVTQQSGASVPTFMRITYPAGSVGEGSEWKAKPFAARDSAHLRYQVRFPTDFDFVRGGKLPGLYGGAGNSGGNIPDGTDGWSTRMMWRAGGKGEVYAYLPTSDTWGTRLGTGSWNFTADGKWHSVEQEVVLNTPGSKNGEVTVWYDGVKVHHATGLTFRTTDTLKVDGVFFSTFFGGNDATWATPRTVHADFANFAVSTGYIGP